MGIDDEVDFHIPFLDSNYVSSSSSPSLAFKRTGNEWTALAHIITAVIGSGVLSLAWSMAQLGWIAGPLSMFLFACVSLTAALLLCDCYKSPDPETGPDRNGCYRDAVQKILEQFRNQTAIMIKVMRLPVDMKVLVAAVMSFTYSIIGSALGLAKVIENGEIKGSIRGLPSSTATEKVWLVAQALGDIAFAFPFCLIFLEVQDTLKAPPPEKITMKKVSIMTSCITTFFYLCCGGFGYAAFGNSTPGNLLTGFGFYEPYWLVDFANACVVLHLVGGYQIFSQPLFADIERWFARKFPESKFVHNNHTLKHLPMLPLRLNFMRLFFRTAYVALITGIAVLFPYFNQVIGVSGSLTFWPIVVYFPVEMYLTQKKTGKWKSKAIALRVYSVVCLVVILYAFVGSIRGVIVARLG
ncbi:probable amino acid permease 7 isoform X3 [Capsicum annuum]|uniref:probable amino acid permease 7 isoform X3 n=1 Tax=Capsicum annuum TaxID=4072 RepID=UPI001FB07844|nr:probable amino acid permease 7 isoform X3 [Capsicum annuum]